jgi:hypothetical protein
MTRKLWVLGIVAILGVSAAIAGVSNTRNASACDDNTKTASAATHSCCSKEAKTASADVHNSMIKSAVVAPGAAPILNLAAFSAMMAGGTHAHTCDWCPGETASASGCAAHMASSECAATMSAGACASKMGAEGASASGCPFMMQQNAAVTADYKGCPHAVSAMVASNEHAGCSASMSASHEGCTGSAAMVASAGHECMQNAGAVAAHDGCTSANKTASAGAGCCGEAKSASTAAGDEACSSAKTASLKGVVDEMPYRENKRVVLAGSYACGHCTLQKTADCSPMLKTADGKIYPLFENARASELRDSEGKNIEVSGTVRKVDGVKYLEVKSYKIL